MAPWKRFFAKAAKSFENQCETEGARSHQSLWKPFRFWFVSLKFWDGVLALQSDTSWCQNWRSGATERQLFAFVFLCFLCRFRIFAGAGAERRCEKNQARGCPGGPPGRKSSRKSDVNFSLFRQKAPGGVRARAGPGHLWCQRCHGGNPRTQMRLLSERLGAKQPESDVIWGRGFPPTHHWHQRDPARKPRNPV